MNESRRSVNVCVSVNVGVALGREVVVQYQTANQSAKGKKWVDRLYMYIRSFDSTQPLQGRIQDFSRGGAKLPDITIWVFICTTVDREIFAQVYLIFIGIPVTKF